MRNYRFRRALVLDRRERAARVAQLKVDMRTWSWWADFLMLRVFPVLVFALIFGSAGAILTVRWIGEELSQHYECVQKGSHAN